MLTERGTGLRFVDRSELATMEQSYDRSAPWRQLIIGEPFPFVKIDDFLHPAFANDWSDCFARM
jgi:hypothetical protein